MVTLGDFNYAYVAGRLLDGENGEDMYSVVCDIRSLADLLGTTPVDDMIRDFLTALRGEAGITSARTARTSEKLSATGSTRRTTTFLRCSAMTGRTTRRKWKTILKINSNLIFIG